MTQDPFLTLLTLLLGFSVGMGVGAFLWEHDRFRCVCAACKAHRAKMRDLFKEPE